MKLAIVDFDGTLLQKQTVPHLLKTWKKLKLTPKAYQQVMRWIIFRYALYKLKIFGVDQKTFRLQAMQKLTYLFQKVAPTTLHHFFEKAFHLANPFLNQAVIDAIEQDKKEGYTVILLSGNYDAFLKHFQSLGFDQVIGTPLFNHDGELINIPNIIIGEKKIEAIKSLYPQVNWQESKAYADAYYDLPILKQVSEPIMVTPDKKLRKYGGKHQWPTLVNLP